MSEKILNRDPGTHGKYLQFLKSGSSDYSINLLKKAGVDMTSPEPILAVARRLTLLLDRIEELLGE